ncbi:MAG TPA: hypothetical protein VF797_07910 [Noviherbaspirillum sp.]
MHTSPASPAIRTVTPSQLDDMPPDIFHQIVVTHISLREGRAITSLACVNRAFAQRMKPYMAPLALNLYRTLENASRGSQAIALKSCTRTLYELPLVNPAHRLELFLRVNTTLAHHFSCQTIEPHIGILMAGLQHLDREEQPAALLTLVETHHPSNFCRTKKQFLNMTARVAALTPSLAQCELAIILESEMPGYSGQEFPERLQVFLSMCMRLQPVYRTRALCRTLLSLRICTREKPCPGVYGFPDDDKQMKHNKDALLRGLHGCLQSLPMREMPVTEQVRLLGKALIMPVLLDDVAEGDQMAISLLRMIPPEDGNFYWMSNAEYGDIFGDLVESMLKQVFERGSRQSVHRFQSLYQAMAHLPTEVQIYRMWNIVLDCAKKGAPGVTPPLIVATAQAALQLDQAHPELKQLYRLFAVCLNPTTLRKVGCSLSVRHLTVDPSEQPDYAQRFDANCSELIQLLQKVKPDIAAKLLAGINGAYEAYPPFEDMLPSPRRFGAELYGRFLKQALAFLQGLPLADSAPCLLRLRLPPLSLIDARHADDWTSSLIMAVARISRDNSLVSPEEQSNVLVDLLENGVNVPYHSPARNRRLLAALAAFPDDVAGNVLARLLSSNCMSHVHADVLFASVIEAATRLPAALRSSVLETAAGTLKAFPDPQDETWAALREERECALEDAYPGIREVDPDLYALMRPGCVPPTEGWGLLLDAVETLPAQHQADRLTQLADHVSFFAFSNNRLSHQERAQCSLRLLSTIIRLPNGTRAGLFAAWLRHVGHQSYAEKERETIQAALLPMLLALPASDGKPLLDAYVATVWPEAERAALRQRAALHWKDPV